MLRNRMFRCIALRFDSTLLDFETTEKKLLDIFVEPWLIVFFDFAEPCTLCMLASR